MQMIVQFKKRGFWSSEVDTEALNEKIFKLNQDGYKVTQVVPISSFGGLVSEYVLLVESTG